MKIAFHFDEKELKLGKEAIVAALKAVRMASQHARTKIFTGTLLFRHAASETSHDQGKTISRVNSDTYIAFVNEWASSQPLRWHALQPAARHTALHESVFAVCCETVDPTAAAQADLALRTQLPSLYLGALEVDESLASHLGAYHLVPLGRIDGTSGAVFWDGISEDSKMHYLIDWFKNAGLNPVVFESLEARYTIFDRDHGMEQSHREAQCRQWMRELFDSVIDHAMSHLSDGAPEIPEKLWSALSQFRAIEVSEQASNVALACRRIFESVADSLFPPTEDASDGRKLGTDKYKNRLLQYLTEQRVGHTEQMLLVATIDAAAAELDNLNTANNKGLHSEIDRMQARRCLLRTILLLDDLIAVRQKPLANRIRPDIDLMKKMAES